MYVTLDHTIAFAKTIVKTATSEDVNYWKDWVYYALLDFGISDEEIDVAELVPHNLIAALPQNCRHITEMSLFDSSGNQLVHKYRTGKQRIYTDFRLANTAIGTTNNINDLVPVDISNDSHNLILGTNGSNVSKILLRYFKYPLDANGNPMIREEEVKGCAYNIKLMQAMRDNENRSEIAQYLQMYQMEADRIKASKKMNSMSPEKAKTVLNDMLRLIPQMNLNLF
jgi:hypothetical protein